MTRNKAPCAIMLALCLLALSGASAALAEESAAPRGYVQRLEILHKGRLCAFGPFVGYYFRPVVLPDLERLEFLAYNEGGFYTRDQPEGALLFKGEARLAELPPDGELPQGSQRIQPVRFDAAPQSWLQTRPGPEYLHFHSCHDTSGAMRLGYWLKHEGQAVFTYDMGGRVEAGSVLYHEVEKGKPDKDFARLIEFDAGPAGDSLSPR